MATTVFNPLGVNTPRGLRPVHRARLSARFSRGVSVLTCATGGGGGRGRNGGGGGGGGGNGPNNGNGGTGDGSAGRACLLALGASIAVFGTAEAAHAATDSISPLDALSNMLASFIKSLGFSGCVGYMSGVALKKISQLAMVVIGTIFVIVQIMAYNGLINIEWDAVQKRVALLADFNGDGKVDGEDLRYMFHSLESVLSKGLPSVAGFSAGFVLGVRSTW